MEQSDLTVTSGAQPQKLKPKSRAKPKPKAKPVYVVDGARTPYLKARATRGPFSAADLAVKCARALLARQPFNPGCIDEVVVGCVMPSENEANIARIVGLRAGCGEKVPAWTVQRNCGSGMQALDCAIKNIKLGRSELVLAGGTEAMSHAPLVLSPSMTNWLAKLRQAKSIPAKLTALAQLRPSYLTPTVALLRGLTDPVVGLNMGQTAEELAYKFGIDRLAMDNYAVSSHMRVAKAKQQQALLEIVSIYDHLGNCYQHDTGLREDTSIEQLAKLPAFFDHKFGSVTAGNSSQITDGACMLLLASEEAVKKHKLSVLGKIVDVHWAALDPKVMGLGPVMAATPLMQRYELSMGDVDYWEINEAFAAQVLACLAAWQDQAFCQEHFALKQPVGSLDQQKLNVDGGAIALGHPVGSSGARIVLHLLNVLKQRNAKRGMAALCIGGGQGGAMLVEKEGV